MRQYPFINPASIGSTTKVEAMLGSKNHIGNFSAISTNFAGVFAAIKKSSQRPFNVIGLRFDNDQEGKYISRTRAYVTYAFHFRFVGNYYLSGGVDFGGLNLSVKGTPSTGDKSEYVPDANSGIWFYNKDLKFGISINQIFNGRLQPYQEISVLRRHFNITAQKTLKISSIFYLKPSFLFRFPSYINYNADYSLELDLADFFGGISIRHRLGGAFWLGITRIRIGNGNLEAVLNYNTPLQKSIVNVSSLEIVCRYGL